MKRADQYRKNAVDSLILAREPMTKSFREYWVTMAEFWFQFAQQVEEPKSTGSVPPDPEQGADHHR